MHAEVASKILPFPATFLLKNLASVTGAGFALKVNPHSETIDEKVRKWFVK